jgi:very-short-patch-repair endonuclease
MTSPDARSARLAARQHGVITLEQALSCGVTADQIDYRVRTRRWRRVHRGVYTIAGAPERFEGRLLAAVFAGGRYAVASDSSAGALYRFDAIEPGALEITVPKRQSGRIAGVRVHHRDLPRTDVASITGIPVTTPIRTVIDLAAALPIDSLEDVLHDAVRRHLVRPVDLVHRLTAEPRRGRRGIGSLIELARSITSRTAAGSRWENKVRRAIERAGLPPLARQHVINDGQGNFVAKVDLAYPEARLYIEYDGGHHAAPRQRAADLDRQNRLSTLGWRPLRFIDADFKRPVAFLVEKVRDASRCVET